MVGGRLIVVGGALALSPILLAGSSARAQINPSTDARTNAAAVETTGSGPTAAIDQDSSSPLVLVTIALLIPSGLALVFGGMCRAKRGRCFCDYADHRSTGRVGLFCVWFCAGLG